MNRKSVIQEYYILAVNEKGYMPSMRADESNAGLVAAGVMDLLLNEVVMIERKKITVVKEIPGELGHIASLYAYLKEKPRTIDKLMNDYMFSTGKRLKELTTEIGESLLSVHAVTEEKGGLFGNKIVYIPEPGSKERLVEVLRSAVLKEGRITPHDMALLCILKETKNLNQYFSKSEGADLKTRLKELKKDPQSKQLAEMVNYVEDMTAIIMCCVMTSIN
ncbi:GPP34 family phosphoprotein [Faecalicatena sp. AGMB00832]|uniref:GPP34 family phosphoprotein n=1 Tax=Faecalicatena faecalis TaxID=2726362 RepID=A0ABS6D461_9FIRM|nr:GPP34 family phosphoprotein [Faecalicatena faecalis]MBU3876382.1 GPP34 family phosphoprotein [Faecalicatena faecalis]